ncbi:MAG TPA: sigma 54-interacting transcriptional regulator, partial [Clostridia bacterium]|nr:sigma 54-interacting transcriptional regulator [Clostridia bacterium]
KIVGILTQHNLLDALGGELRINSPIRFLMNKNVITIQENAFIEETWKLPVKILPVVNEGGELVGILTQTDLLKAFYEKAEEAHDELSAILASAHNGIIAINREGLVVNINAAAERLIGISAEEALGKPVNEIIPGTGLLETMETGKAQYGKKQQLNNKTVITNRTPLIKKGKIVGAVGIFQDISELEMITQELSESRRLNKELDGIIESSYDGIFITDGNGTVLRANSAFERITGVKVAPFLNGNVNELVEQGIFSQSVTMLVINKRAPVTIVQQIKVGDKAGKETIVTGSPIFDENGNVSMVVTNVRDISELNELKQQLHYTKELSERYCTELEELRAQQLKLDDIIAYSAEMKKIIELSTRVARVDSTVLITGESGVGKEIIAKLIHRASKRSSGPLIRINCGAIPENLLESELFGYESGAFTGARKDGKPGMFELAEGGTLFLDEIGEMPLSLQVKLLRVLQEREIVRVGGTKPTKVDVRIVTATNSNLEEMVANGTFREDLYYRLNVVNIAIPPLRERVDDIPHLALHFIKKFNTKYNMNKKMTLEAIDRLCQYSWPGNVRELENLIERLVVMVREEEIGVQHLPDSLQGRTEVDKGNVVSISEIVPLKKALEEVEKQLLSKALHKYGSTRKVAKVLGINQSTVVRKANRYELTGSGG